MEGPILEGLTFDDVLLVPGKSSVLPTEVDTRTQLTRKISLNIPLVSAAMDIMTKYRVSGLPVTRGPRLVGILTNRDLRFERNLDQTVSAVMTKDNLITVSVGTTLEEAERLLQRHRIEKLLVVDKDFNLKGLITVKDIQKKMEFPRAAKDEHGRLRVGAAVGATGDFLERAVEMSKTKAEVLAIDTAHGHCQRVPEAIKAIRHRLPEMQLVAGNVATYEGAKELIALGIDGLKVGIGPGSICTTRVVTGAGVPQLTAIMEAARAAKGTDVPIIADGGIKYSGDITKAIAAGASCVMIGSLFAGTEEAPGETILYQGRTFKSYRGMGSTGAMESGSDRYALVQDSEERGKSVPEGVEGRVPYKGQLGALTDQLVGGLRSGMGYVGAATLKEFQEKSRFVRVTAAGLRESHVHDVIITKEAPNYRME